ncbi:MAG: TfoX/Sxy family protein [Gallionella sp.]|jgi:DNA transformation protein
MATAKNTIDFLLDQLSGAGEVSAKKMFGEYCLYLAGKPVGLVCDDQLFLKPSNAGRSMISEPIEGAPYPGAKPHLLISGDLWEDREWLCELLRATERELPQPKPRKSKARINA